MADITADELSAEILDIVDDNSFSFSDVVTFLNEGLGVISFQVLLPNFQASANVLTVDGSNVADLPSNYQRNLFFCYSTLQTAPVRVFDNKTDIIRYHGNPTTNGSVRAVAVFGSTLYYQNIPLLAEIDTLVIDYYKQPTIISEVGDTFTCLPPHLIRPLLVNYGCAKIFETIEQDIDGSKPNTNYHFNLFNGALELLSKAYPQK